MRAVLYSREFEPITILDLPRWALDQGCKVRHVDLFMVDRVCGPGSAPGQLMTEGKSTLVRMQFERVIAGPTARYWITTPDDVSELRLDVPWLSGQSRNTGDYARRLREVQAALMAVLARGVGGH